MPVDYIVAENPLRSGEMFIRVVPKGTVRKEQIIDNISKRTLIQPVDVRAVLDALDDEVIDYLILGNSVIIDDFLGFTISITLDGDGPVTDPGYTIAPDDVRVNVNVSVKNTILRRVRDRLRATGDFNKTTVRVRSPQPRRVFDVLSQATGQYTPGGPIEITGDDLDLPNDFEPDPQQGVFFVPAAGGPPTRATIYMAEGPKKIVCIVPPGLVGEMNLIVNTNYGGPNLRTGLLEGLAQA